MGKKLKHGGKRKGAGRKKGEPTKIMTFRVPAKKYNVLFALMKKYLKQLLNK